MLTHLPLDDELNRLFYVEEGTWRLVWANALGRCVMRREREYIAFDEAVAMIASGDLLWAPPTRLERLETGTPIEAVQRELTILSAYLASPAGKRVRWTMRQGLEMRVSDVRDWLAERALTLGDAGSGDE